MAKKVLLIESSLAVRGIAESLLRQNGYEVVAADTIEAAREILEGSKIDLLMVASDIRDENDKPYYESLGADSSTAILPLLILHDPAVGEELAYPPEAIINKPFTPRDFLESVTAFCGGFSVEESSPLNSADFEDAIIDSALGLDKIEVDDAEVLEDDTSTYRKQSKKNKVETLIGFEAKRTMDDSAKTPINNINAINIPPDPSESPAQPTPKTESPKTEESQDDEFLGKPGESPGKMAEKLSESSKIEIITDQYGITVPPGITESGSVNPDADHDYDWFMKELQKENTDDKSPKPEVKKQPEKPPVTDSVPSRESSPGPPQGEEQSSIHTKDADKFITEFKKEMEKITGEVASNIEVTNIVPTETLKPEESSSKDLQWEEGLEKVTPAEMHLFSKQMVEIIAAQIAEKIVARLDEDIIYHLIKDSIDNILSRHKKEKNRKP